MTIDAGLVASITSGQLADRAGGSLMTGRGKQMSLPQAEKAAKDFEAMFLTQMMEQMFGDSIGEEVFGDSETTDIYKSLMVNEYGKTIANAGGIGIARHVKSELLKLQEVKP